MTPQWILAIESSGLGGSVALLEPISKGGVVLFDQVVLPADRGSVSTLAPAIDAMLRGRRLDVADLGLIAVTAGPGSFTGVRVGLATAKLLGWAAEKPVVAVDSLAAIAQRFQQAWQSSSGSDRRPAESQVSLVTIMNAFRKQLFTASWTVDAAGIVLTRASAVVDLDVWLCDPWGTGQSQPVPLWISGSGISLLSAAAGGSANNSAGTAVVGQASWQLASETLWQPLAEQVGHLGWAQFQAGHAVAAAELQPNYLRASAAEEKRRAGSGA